MDLQQEVYKLIEPMLDFWLLVSLTTTLVVVQFFKAAIKHYTKKHWEPFTITAAILGFAVIIGYSLTRFFLELPSGLERRMAMAVALLNVAIYEVTLMYAKRQGWVRFEALLRMKKVCKDADGNLYVGNHTALFKPGDDNAN